MVNVSNKKLLCYSNKYYLFCRGTKLYSSKVIGEKEHLIGHLPIRRSKVILSSFRFTARALRLEPRCGIFVDDVTALVSFHGAIYCINCVTGEIALEHIYRNGMNNPLSFVKVNGVIYYGEYFLNHNGEPVSIYKRTNFGTWDCVYTFPAGEIYHIHGIIPYYTNDCIYVLTGDKDEESGIYQCNMDFSNMTPIVKGKQAYRACVALPTENGIIYATDTPLEENYLYYLDLATKEISPIKSIAGPAIYGRLISDTEMIFSTSVEPDSRIKGLRYEFTYKLGTGVKDRRSHLYHVKWDGKGTQVKELAALKKDILPMGAGQFGTMMFPAGEKVFVVGQALRKYDNKTFELDER